MQMFVQKRMQILNMHSILANSYPTSSQVHCTHINTEAFTILEKSEILRIASEILSVEVRYSDDQLKGVVLPNLKEVTFFSNHFPFPQAPVNLDKFAHVTKLTYCSNCANNHFVKIAPIKWKTFSK